MHESATLKNVPPDTVEVDEIDDVAVVQAVDDVADRAADDHAEGDADQARTRGGLAKTQPKDDQNDHRHADQQNGLLLPNMPNAPWKLRSYVQFKKCGMTMRLSHGALKSAA